MFHNGLNRGDAWLHRHQDVVFTHRLTFRKMQRTNLAIHRRGNFMFHLHRF